MDLHWRRGSGGEDLLVGDGGRREHGGERDLSCQDCPENLGWGTRELEAGQGGQD